MTEEENLQRVWKNLEDEGLLVNSISSLGWAFWPCPNGGFFDEHLLRKLADEIERRNKPFWDSYEEYCNKQQPLEEGEEVCFTLTSIDT